MNKGESTMKEEAFNDEVGPGEIPEEFKEGEE